jgi:lipopolysaccharide/colanic/teichoic acid biosynthesis glycosyltransferase
LPAGGASYLIIKRLVDLTICVFISPFAILACVLIAIAIRVDSAGPIFYRHMRIGRNGIPFGMWKFRTMCRNADSALERYLLQHPELMEEWCANHKLKCDPRVTRIGAILRRTSLDELAQIWNVLNGTMSFVGPRPIVDAEIYRYGKHFSTFTCMKPGVTGLWQVSGRSALSYETRVKLDVRYACEWSPLLDTMILLKTVPCVFRSNGAC